MVPAAFVVLDALPLTPNGKVDRRALPRPGLPRGHDARGAAHAEAALERIWAELLGLPEVGVHDDFFELGGHSLLRAADVAARRAVPGARAPSSTSIARPPCRGRGAARAGGSPRAPESRLQPLLACEGSRQRRR